MRTYIVLAHALGIIGGMARQDEVINEDQLPAESIPYLTSNGMIQQVTQGAPPAPAKAPKEEAPKPDAPAPPEPEEPDQMTARELFELGVIPDMDEGVDTNTFYWLERIQDQEEPEGFELRTEFKLNTEGLKDVKNADIKQRIEAAGGKAPSNANREKVLAILEYAISEYIMGLTLTVPVDPDEELEANPNPDPDPDGE